MRVGHFTRLKGRTTYFRRKVPLILRGRLASSEICVKLGVVDRDSAERQARRLAVAVDEFFVEAANDNMLNAADLKTVIASTMATWRADDQRRDTETVMAWGSRSPSPRDHAALLGEMAHDVLEAQGAGRNVYDAAYVQERFSASGVPSISDPAALHLAGRQLSVALAAHYLGAAVEIADRHDLGHGLRRLPLEAWRRHLDRLKSELVGGEPEPVTIQHPATESVAAATTSAPMLVAEQPSTARGRFVYKVY